MRPHLVVAGVLAGAISVALPAFTSAQRFEPPGSDHLNLPSPKAGRVRPLVVIVAENLGAETTDFTVPYGVLKDAGVADVRSLSTGAGPVQLRRSLRILADQTIGQFDALEPAGADIVIVPAQVTPKDPALAAWIQAQAAKGATIVSVCEGARVLANAGLLKGKRAATHWSAIKDLTKSYPDTTWVRDQRYVQDGQIISTTGVTASIPMSLALVEAIGGEPVAQATARRFGVTGWSAAHRTSDFALQKRDVAAALGSMAAVWTHETLEAPVADGVDEVALALRMDAWGRSYRTTVVTTRAGRTAVRSRHGLTILPDAEPRNGGRLMPERPGSAAAQLDAAIVDMGRRYGPAAVRLAKIGLEYDPPGQREN
ncbi:MAG TPA: DJ-1/PfpI family protein [Phenylobacterium sp.]|nr:DJ-1/PfpI family protein [Phenylobacterium sp.]